MNVFDKLSNYIEELEQGGRQARERVVELVDEVKKLEEENKKLNEFKERREESMFYFKAQMERAEPKTAKEAEDLQRAKELFEGIYRGELYYLEQENKELKECNLNLQEWLDNKEKVNKSLREELEKLKSTYVYDAKQVRDIC